MDLLQCIDQIFSESGTMVQLGGRYTEEQHKYARYIAESLINDSFTLSVLEAETGIGKTIGYLTPILGYLALKNTADEACGKMVISTYSRQLQKQIFDNDLAFAIQLIESVGLVNTAKTAYRMGRQAFFSLERTANSCKRICAKKPARKKELQAFIDYVKTSMSFGSGLWSSYLTEYGAFPDGINSSDICLLDKQNIDNDAYLVHLERASSCDVLITNHISLLQPDKTGLADLKIEAIILDEAHTVGELCLDLFNNQSSLTEIKKGFYELGSVVGHSKLKKSAQCLDTIDTIIKASPHYSGDGIICKSNDPDNFHNISSCVYTITSELKPAIASLEKKLNKAECTLEDVEFLAGIHKTQETLANWQNIDSNQFQMSAVTLSTVQRKPSLSSLNLFGSRLFASIIKRLTNKVILTSGTISDISINGGFVDFKSELGFKDTPINFECSLAPKSYGKLNFVLCSKDTPKPLSSRGTDDETLFNKDWLQNTANMIKKAKESKKPILVLTVSHQESIELANALGNTPDIAVQHSGNTLSELSRAFTIEANDYKVLITSAGWEGLNLRNSEGGQFIHHLIIARLPFTPPKELQEFLVKEFIRMRHSTTSNELNLNWINMLRKTIPKLRQGFGRSTRGPNDIVTVWIADSRMPHTRQDRLSPLLKAIPKRFMGSYFKAEIFGETKKEIFFV